MSFWPVVAAFVLVAVAVDVARAVTTRDDLGPLEYVTTYALLIVLAATAVRSARRGVRRR